VSRLRDHDPHSDARRRSSGAAGPETGVGHGAAATADEGESQGRAERRWTRAGHVQEAVPLLLDLRCGAAGAGGHQWGHRLRGLGKGQVRGEVDPTVLISTLSAALLLPNLAGLAESVVLLIFLYKAWSLVQDGSPRTSPGKAVGFLFIPIFSIYWVFVAWYGLAKDLNTYAEERQMEARKASAGMVLWGIILTLMICPAPIGAILGLIGFISIKNACVDIATAKAGT